MTCIAFDRLWLQAPFLQAFLACPALWHVQMILDCRQRLIIHRSKALQDGTFWTECIFPVVKAQEELRGSSAERQMAEQDEDALHDWDTFDRQIERLLQSIQKRDRASYQSPGTASTGQYYSARSGRPGFPSILEHTELRQNLAESAFGQVNGDSIVSGDTNVADSPPAVHAPDSAEAASDRAGSKGTGGQGARENSPYFSLLQQLDMHISSCESSLRQMAVPRHDGPAGGLHACASAGMTPAQRSMYSNDLYDSLPETLDSPCGAHVAPSERHLRKASPHQSARAQQDAEGLPALQPEPIEPLAGQAAAQPGLSGVVATPSTEQREQFSDPSAESTSSVESARQPSACSRSPVAEQQPPAAGTPGSRDLLDSLDEMEQQQPQLIRAYWPAAAAEPDQALGVQIVNGSALSADSDSEMPRADSMPHQASAPAQQANVYEHSAVNADAGGNCSTEGAAFRVLRPLLSTPSSCQRGRSAGGPCKHA